MIISSSGKQLFRRGGGISDTQVRANMGQFSRCLAQEGCPGLFPGSSSRSSCTCGYHFLGKEWENRYQEQIDTKEHGKLQFLLPQLQFLHFLPPFLLLEEATSLSQGTVRDALFSVSPWLVRKKNKIWKIQFTRYVIVFFFFLVLCLLHIWYCCYKDSTSWVECCKIVSRLWKFLSSRFLFWFWKFFVCFFGLRFIFKNLRL